MDADLRDTLTLEIVEVAARQILDSRGFPTIQVALRMADGTVTEAAAPAGASTGAHEAAELRDGGAVFAGRGVKQAIHAADGELADLLTGRLWESLDDVDRAMRQLDGTPTLRRLGANTIVALSMATSRGFAVATGVPLHAWIGSRPVMGCAFRYRISTC